VLITDKTRPYTPRLETLDNLALQISRAIKYTPDLQLVLGHGSGSFGHQAANQFGTREGVSGKAAWHGFTEVWYQASELNRLIVKAIRNSGLPAITLSPVSSVTARDGKVSSWDLSPLHTMLANDLLPILHGDVVFDENRGGTILSTEDLFAHLALQVHPRRILLAGLEDGVWEDYPARRGLIREMTPRSFAKQASGLGRSSATDVTGGMEAKVKEMLALVEQVPGLEVLIFSGAVSGNIQRALAGENPGTRLFC
jgi:isopentenyl phosphate kinase